MARKEPALTLFCGHMAVEHQMTQPSYLSVSIDEVADPMTLWALVLQEDMPPSDGEPPLAICGEAEE